MKSYNFDTGWDDFIEITLFGETHEVRMCTFNDSKKVEAVQEELNKLGDTAVAEGMVDFLVEKFKEAGASYTKEQFMNLAPAKSVAIMRMITRGEVDTGPLEAEVS